MWASKDERSMDSGFDLPTPNLCEDALLAREQVKSSGLTAVRTAT